MLITLTLAVTLLGQQHHQAAHPATTHPAAAMAHPSGHVAAVEHQVMHEIAGQQAAMQQQQQQHMAMVRQDLPHVEAHFREMKFDHRHWDEIRRYHERLGVDAFWRLARKHKDIEKLLAALKEEALPLDSARRRLGVVERRHEEWEAAALRADIARLEAYLQEMKFDRRHWDMLRYYHDRLGIERFWRLAREYEKITSSGAILAGRYVGTVVCAR